MGVGDMEETRQDNTVVEQLSLIESVQKVLRNFKKDSATRKTEAYHHARLDSLASYRVEFRENHRVLVRKSLETIVKETYIDAAVSDKFEECYIEAVATIRESLTTKMVTQPRRDNTDASTTNQVSYGVPLPEVKLPTFSGKHIEWPAFKEVFLDRIHQNENLSSLQRFHYLKSALVDDALQDIQHFGLIGENYQEAWNMLCKQYDNNRILFTHYMDVLDQQPDVLRDDPISLKRFIQTCRSCFSTIKNLGVNIDYQNQILAYFLVKKLPNSIRTEWDHSLRKQTSIPTTTELLSLLDEQYLMMVTSSKQKPAIQRKSATSGAISFGKKELKSMHAVKKATTCPICEKSDHPVRECAKFIEMSVIEKRAAVENFKLCFNCLGYNHRSSKCSSRQSCRICKGKHHTLIHVDRDEAVPTLTSVTHLATNNSSIQSRTNRQRSTSYDVLLPTAVVTIKSEHGQFYHFRALLDQGSQASFVTGRVVQLLGLHRDKTFINVSGLSGSKIMTGRYRVNLSIGSRLDPLVNYHVVAYVLPKVAGVLPENKVSTAGCGHLQNLDLADPKYFEPQRIDILLGSDLYDDCILDDTRKAGTGLPIAQKTTFGYIVSGKRDVPSPSSTMLSSLHTQLEIDQLLRKFWELEEVSEPFHQSDEDKWCEKFYSETHERLENGKYLVRLPLKTDINSTEFIGRSRTAALKRLEHLERRLSKDKILKEVYIESINEYLKMGQMKPVMTTEDQHCVLGDNQMPRLTCCYLPHHPVIKESSTSTRVRIVFDASMKTSNGKSLNDILAIGPALQRDLSAIITNWRTFKYVFMADIEKMFRRIEIHEEDAQYQRILWREDPSLPIQEYYCSTVMFGTASAPYMAIRTMHQLALDEGSRYPMAAEVIKQQMYVDDILSGADSIDLALQKQNEVVSMLQSASFELRKWASNHHILLENIPPEYRYSQDVFEFKSADAIKALGLYWDSNTDEFTFKVNFEIVLESPTKRSILSTVARLFDPLGWLNPVIISAKIILQELWASKLGWDTQIPDDIQKCWRKFGEELSAITQLRVPRWVGSGGNSGSYQLHLFSDASKFAYSAAAYIRICNDDGPYAVNLLLAKCKVNPIKPKLTTPRAELCGAVLAIKLLKFIKQNFCMHFATCNTFLWTDSSIVLYWIRGDSSRWKQFVSNRVQKIKAESIPEQWRHISSENNPADISSRGISPSRLVNSDLWWHGPPFLQLPFNEWPESPFAMPCPIVAEEERTVKAFLTSSMELEPNDLLTKWSSFSKTVRMVSYCLRFGRKCLPRLGPRTSGRLSSEELNEAVFYIIRLVQQESFPCEWKSLSSNLPIPEKSVLRPLNPFFDKEKRIIRLGGRLKHAFLSVDQKHPFIIPAKHHITRLIVDCSHIGTLHGGVTLTLNHIRRRFWILNGRNVVRSVLHRCVTCFKNQPQPCTQMMGALPAQRVRPGRVFSSTGVDYAGPFNVLPSKGRGRTSLKGYIALFICLATKAIHLELVGDLSTNAFIGAFNRFIARRGMCSDIYSDCGTNFVGANRKLKEDRNTYQRFIEKIYPHLAQQQVRWHFIPPSSPHFGGLWEAGVKSTKYHLKRTIGEQRLTYEELSTVLAQIESCLNSRPLCPLTNDPDDLMVLTPGHFLIGDSLLALPRVETNRTSIITRWHHCQHLVQNFWGQWSNEYLSRLQQRPKWLKQNPNLKINDVVMIKDERFPCNNWPLGRIVELHPGTDNLVRVVTLKTKNGLVKRPIVKLCPLPVQDNWQDSAKDQTQ